jgi:LPS-assembly lipoprotein
VIAARRRLLLSAGAAIGLAGCGFQPVYMPTASGQPGPAPRGLASVQVELIPGRPGQLLRQALQRELGSDSGTAIPHYALAVSYGISGEGVGILPDSTATRIRMIGHADWRLSALSPARAQVSSGSAQALDGVDVLNSQYFSSDLESEAVQRRVADRIAREIAIQLAIWFRSHPDRAG